MREILFAVSYFYILMRLGVFALDTSNNLILTRTLNGWVKGEKAITQSGNTPYYAYRGVPFAIPPLGELRFEAPRPVNSWNGILDATKEKDTCLQSFQTTVKMTKILGSEDCLYLNIYTPISPLDTSLQQPRAVMVWIYGGGFFEGDNSYALYAPDRLLDEDVVFVALNYRLGLFGFFGTEDSVAPGNNGLRDQILALTWIKNNIKAFGGDAERITIFGQSAGAASVSYLTQTPLTQGLYHRAIMQSGSSITPWALSVETLQLAQNTAALLGINATSTSDLKRKLKSVEDKSLLAMGTIAIFRLYGSFPLGGIATAPHIEPPRPGAVVTASPYGRIASGQFHRTPFMIGIGSMEVVDIPLYAAYRTYLDTIQLASERLVPSSFGTLNATSQKAVGDALKSYYFGDLSAVTFTDAQYIRFFSAALFAVHGIEVAQLISKYTDAYFYQLSYLGELGNPLRPDTLGVGHSEDTNYLFKRINSPPSVSQSDLRTSARIVRLWTNFAKTGNPTPTRDSLLQNVKWPKVDANVKYLDIGDNLVVGVKPKESEYNFWMNLFATYRNLA